MYCDGSPRNVHLCTVMISAELPVHRYILVGAFVAYAMYDLKPLLKNQSGEPGEFYHVNIVNGREKVERPDFNCDCEASLEGRTA